MGWDNHIEDPDGWESYVEAALGIWDLRDKTVPPIVCKPEDVDESGGVKDAA